MALNFSALKVSLGFEDGPEAPKCLLLIRSVRRQLLLSSLVVSLPLVILSVVLMQECVGQNIAFFVSTMFCVWLLLAVVLAHVIAHRLGMRFQALLFVISEFVHEFGSPLAALKTNLADSPSGEIHIPAERVIILRDVCQRIISLNEDLRLIANWGAPVRQSALMVASPSKLAASCYDELKERFSSLGITLNLDLQTEDTLVCDNNAIKRVLLILLDNAAKYCPAESEVKVTVQRAGNEFRIIVADNGKGLPLPSVDKVFDRSFRGEKHFAGKIGGMGIGLTIAKEVIESHGGKIQAKQVQPTGMEFLVILPRVPNQHPSSQFFS